VVRKGKSILHFKSAKAYNAWLAYGHIHKLMKGCGRVHVFVHGKQHKVHHPRKCDALKGF
jgi:hypothetical protein